MIDVIKLIRPNNLIIIALTMIIMRAGVINGNIERGLIKFFHQINIEAERETIDKDYFTLSKFSVFRQTIKFIYNEFGYLLRPLEYKNIDLPPALQPQLSPILFALLVLSTMLIAAGGNVINDYFDTRIDRINKPGAVIVGRSVKRRTAGADAGPSPRLDRTSS